MENNLLSGKYELQRELGSGGMGVVREALQVNLNRRVAIKILHTQYTADPAFLKRFYREARALARLNHENIIGVHDVGEDHGLHYIVMELFLGTDLKQIIMEKGSISPKEALPIVLQMARALSYAHNHGIIHRDIKPGNVMIDAQGKIKIADFGIAAATDEISLTSTGQIIGTLKYMSPEQARGETLDGRSDLYALGMVLYELLTGKTIFHQTSQVAIVASLLQHGEEHPLSFPQGTPSNLCELVASLLKKKTTDRIPDAETLVNRIERLLEGTSKTTVLPHADATSDTVMCTIAQPDIPKTNPIRWQPFFAVGTALVLIIIAGYLYFRPVVPETPVEPPLQTSLEEPTPITEIKEEAVPKPTPLPPPTPKPPPVPLPPVPDVKPTPIPAALPTAPKETKVVPQPAPIPTPLPVPAPPVAEVIPPEPLPPPKPIPPPIPAARPDIEVVSILLKQFKTAYENKDMGTLQEISTMSGKTTQFLKGMFQNVQTIKVSISNLSLSKDSAQAVVTVTSMVDQQGRTIQPKDLSQNIAILKQDGHWGKVKW